MSEAKVAMNNQTTLVLLPGLDGTEVFFGPLLRHLPDWVEPKIIVYPDTGPNDYDSLLSMVLDEIAPLENFVILGWSFGGPLALRVASRCPARISGLILCGSFVTPPRAALVPLNFALSGPVVAVLRAMGRMSLFIPGFTEPEFFQAKVETWDRVSSEVLASRSRAALTVDVRQELQACQAPLMYLAATHDEVVPRDCLNEVLALAPATRVLEVEGPHLVLFSNPVASAAAIVNFLNSLTEDLL